MKVASSSFKRAIAVRFKDLKRWDVKYFRAGNWHWPTEIIKPLYTFTYPDFEPISLEMAKERRLPIISKISFSGELYLRPKEDYEGYKGKLFIVRPNRIIFSKINARHGCIFYVPFNYQEFVVSTEYPTLKINEQLALGEYVNLALRVGPAKDNLLGSASGMAKARTHLEDFQGIEIPLPSLSVQKAIVARWQTAKEEIAVVQQQVELLKAEIDTQFLKDLGLNPPTLATSPKVFAVLWKEFLRWGVDYNQKAQTGSDISLGKYPVVELSSILDVVQYGTSEKANENGKGTPILRIINIKEGFLDLTALKYIELLKKTKESLLLKDGDILIIRTSGSRDLVGTCAVFHANSEYVFASYLIRLRVNYAKADPDFISWFINSPLGRQQVDAISRQIMQNNINSEEIRSLQVPLPPLEIQRIIMRHVREGLAETDRKREATERCAREIEVEVEALVLGTKRLEGHTSYA